MKRQIIINLSAFFASILLIAASLFVASSKKSKIPPITPITVKCVKDEIKTYQSAPCYAIVDGKETYGNTISWSVDVGSINPYGVYSASSTETTATITVKAINDTSRYATIGKSCGAERRSS